MALKSKPARKLSPKVSKAAPAKTIAAKAMATASALLKSLKGTAKAVTIPAPLIAKPAVEKPGRREQQIVKSQSGTQKGIRRR